MKKKKTVGLVSLGCAKNAVDLQVITGHLLKRGFALASGGEPCDVTLVNTCAFIASAREEAEAEIERACALKREGLTKAVVVAGCYAQRYGTRVKKLFPDVDAVMGIDALDRAPEILSKLADDIPVGHPNRVFDPPVPALRFTGAAFAYLKIAEGCVHRCSYCAIPGIRGGYRSRTQAAILAEARELLATGVKELDVVAQDPMLWGFDLEPRTDLVALLKALDALEGDFVIRVLYAYPSEITDAFLDWLATARHAAKYLDVPLQHTDPNVLKMMGRGSAVKATLEAVSRIRAAVPGVTLRTTVMTGFPGETDDAFAKLLLDVKRFKFDYLGVFAFSPEEGTPAAEMSGRPSAEIALKRARKVASVQRAVWKKIAGDKIGKRFRALVVAPGVARLESQAPEVDGVVRLRTRKPPEVGAWIKVRLTGFEGCDFEGVVVK